MTDDELELAANEAFDRVKPVFTGLNCQIVGHVLASLTANWLLSLEAEPPDPEETETWRADALEQLALKVVRLVREHEDMRKTPQ